MAAAVRGVSQAREPFLPAGLQAAGPRGLSPDPVGGRTAAPPPGSSVEEPGPFSQSSFLPVRFPRSGTEDRELAHPLPAGMKGLALQSLEG